MKITKKYQCNWESGTEIKNNVHNKLKRTEFYKKSVCSEKLAKIEHELLTTNAAVQNRS